METSFVGKVCPYCQSPIKPGANVVVCNACGIPHHAECWQENGRCTTYGCTGTPVTSDAQPPVTSSLNMQPTTAPPPPGMPPVPGGPAAPQQKNGLAIASLVLGIAGLVSCGILGPASLIGLILGIVALNNTKKDPRIGGQQLAVAGIITSASFILVVPILASILFPVFAKAREKSRQAVCTSNQRQLAVAIQMYVQDNGGQYPGADWVNQISPYLGGSAAMFICPSDGTSESGIVSYGYSGMLVDGAFGIKEANVLSPSEVGAICDAGPSRTYPTGGIIGLEAEPVNRHSRGLVISYCDGHAKYVAGGYVAGNSNNEVTRAFYEPRQAGLLK